MPETDEASVSVTLAEIARIAGVGRAAVSNWRRRHESFPGPTGGTDTSPQFSLPAVERWLRENNKLRSPTGLMDRLWPRFDAIGDRDAMGRVIAALGLHGADRKVGPDLALSAEERALLDETRSVAREEGHTEVFQFLLDRWLTAHVRQIITTPEPLARLMAEIANATAAAPVSTVLDPACGSGTLLLFAPEHLRGGRRLRLIGQDDDAVLAAVAAARLQVGLQVAHGPAPDVEISAGDSLRGGPHAGAGADVVLSSPPTNERDWGQEELTADPRWMFGLPPRSESELAWVQEAIASLAPGGTGVLLFPPGVATRRAGRRIRAALLRAGALRAVIALPAGAAPPYGVGLHLWVVRRPDTRAAGDGLLLVDTGDCRTTATVRRPGIDWDAVRQRIRAALRGDQVEGTRAVPLIELFDDQLDLSPARHVLSSRTAAGTTDLREGWSRFMARLERVAELSRRLSALTPSAETVTAPVSIAELERADVLSIGTGRTVPDELLGHGGLPENALPVLTVPDLLAGHESERWIPAAEIGEDSGRFTVAEPGDVVVVGVQRAFDAWVQQTAPVVLGAQLLAIRPDRDQIDTWYLAGCLRTLANVRRAGGHASTSSRIDARRLEVPRLPLEDQRQYGEVFREVAAFDESLRELAGAGTALRNTLGELLATGRLSPG